MAKFRGVIGYATSQVETKPGIWGPGIIEKLHSGDVLRNTNLWEQTASANDNLTVKNKISIVSNPYINENLSNIRYVEWMGEKWKVTSVDILRPRVILTIGGVYNGS